ncbi:MAG: LysR substrate-binding domain-containing protein [Telluria sp.]
MDRPLRSLSGLIDFECAARWGSFKLAAQELHKTPAAISQQVKHLEDAIGIELFIRHPRHVELTEKGHELAVSVTKMLSDLRAKIGGLQGGNEERVLRISTTHSFTIKWLVPRMHRFTKLHPELEIRLDSNDKPVNLDDDSTDVVIRYGLVHEGDPSVLFRERLVAVYSPELLAEGQEEITLADLPGLPLLYEASTESWLHLLNENKAFRKGKFNFARGYSHWGVLAQAAAAGQGVAMVPVGLAFDDLQKGVLRQVRCKSAPYAKGYKFLANPAKLSMSKIQRFRAWIDEEMEAMRQALDA